MADQVLTREQVNRALFPRLNACAVCGTVVHLVMGEESKPCPLCDKIAAAVAAEREACAKVAAAHDVDNNEASYTAARIAREIRSRK